MRSQFGLIAKSRIARLMLFTVPTTLIVFFVTFSDVVQGFSPTDLPAVMLKGISLTYYRAADQSHYQESTLDSYNSFQKDATGSLQITPTGISRLVENAQSVYQGYRVKTQKGHPVEIYLEIPTVNHRYQSNCHGFTFLAGEYWMFGSQVQRILDDNGWTPIPEPETQTGDVAVYRQTNGRICHTARVVGRDDGGHVLVTSKNGFDALRSSIRAVDVVPN